MKDQITIYVYGAEEKCASCVHLPSSQETASWLQAALKRRYTHVDIQVKHVDIYQPQNAKEQEVASRIIAEEQWYPLVIIEDEVVAEGNPRLQAITAKIDQLLASV